MDALILQLLNSLDKGGAYALIALGLTLVFGTLGVVNFAHGAIFMIGALSGGEQQMRAIGRALARDIKLLLLDEPYEGLAPVVRHDIEKALILETGEIVYSDTAADAPHGPHGSDPRKSLIYIRKGRIFGAI